MQGQHFFSNGTLAGRRVRRGVVTLSALLVIASIGCSGGSPSKRGGDLSSGSTVEERDSRVGEVAKSRLDEIGFRTLWKTPTGGAIVQSYCVGGNLYVVRPGSDHPFILEKLDGESGLTVWTYALRGKLDYPPVAYAYPQELRAVKPPELFFVQDDELVGLDDRYGTKNFSVNLSFPASTSPVPDMESVYLGSWNRRFYAIDKETRLESWSYITDDTITAPAVVGDANVYFGSEDHTLYACTRGGGYVPGRSWRFSTNAEITSQPTIHGDRIFLSSEDYKVYCLEDTGPEAYTRWSYPTGAPVISRPFPYGDSIFVITREDRGDSIKMRIHSINCIYGRLQWEAEGAVEVLAADGVYVYAKDVDGNVRAYRLDDGQLDWTLESSGYDQILGQDAEQGRNRSWWGRMFLVDDTGVVHAIMPNR